MTLTAECGATKTAVTLYGPVLRDRAEREQALAAHRAKQLFFPLAGIALTFPHCLPGCPLRVSWRQKP